MKRNFIKNEIKFKEKPIENGIFKSWPKMRWKSKNEKPEKKNSYLSY